MYLLGKGVSPNYGTALVQRVSGLGCVSCGSASCNNGLGLFDSGMNLSQWGLAEWGVVGAGLFAAYSMLSTGRRGVRSARKGIAARRSKAQRRAQLQAELSRL